MQNRIIEIMQRDRQLSVAKFILSLKISINYNFLLCNIVNGKANESFRCNVLTLKHWTNRIFFYSWNKNLYISIYKKRKITI